MAGTHEDAVLVVELAKLGAMNGLAEAAGKIFADDFDPNAAELSDPSVRIVLGWNETVATLVKNELLSRDRHDWLWVAGTWDRVGRRRTSPRGGWCSRSLRDTSRRWRQDSVNSSRPDLAS